MGSSRWGRAQTRPGREGGLRLLLVPAGLRCRPPRLPSLSSCRSVNQQKNLVELSFLPSDTGKPDVFPAPPGQPLPKPGERQGEAEQRDPREEGEKERKRKNRERKEKREQKGQEEVQVPGKEKKEPQQPQAKRQGKRPRLGSGSEQVRPQGGRLPCCGKQSNSEAAGQLPCLLWN